MTKDIDFLKNTLILLIILIVYIYIKQKYYMKHINNVSDVDYRNNFLPNAKIQNLESSILKKIENKNKPKPIYINKNNLVEFTNGKTYLGPERNFHQSFNNQHITTAGWRKWWCNNQRYNLITRKHDQFQPKIRNFLNNQENTKNIYL